MHAGDEYLSVLQRIENIVAGDLVVWRSVDLAKFLGLLQTSELHFIRLDRLEDSPSV